MIDCYLLVPHKDQKTGILIAHIIKTQKTVNNLVGSLCEEQTAYCGQINPGFSDGHFQIHHGKPFKFLQLEVCLCHDCLVACPAYKKIEGYYIITPEEAGFESVGTANHPHYIQKRCRFCGSLKINNKILPGEFGDNDHYVECRDCYGSEPIGLE